MARINSAEIVSRKFLLVKISAVKVSSALKLFKPLA